MIICDALPLLDQSISRKYAVGLYGISFWAAFLLPASEGLIITTFTYLRLYVWILMLPCSVFGNSVIGYLVGKKR